MAEEARQRLHSFFQYKKNLATKKQLAEANTIYRDKQTNRLNQLQKFVLQLYSTPFEEWVAEDSPIWDQLLLLPVPLTPIEQCLGVNHQIVQHRLYYGHLQ